ncbi:hypothetical protein RN001_008049, partial [Aquatica leii]
LNVDSTILEGGVVEFVAPIEISLTQVDFVDEQPTTSNQLEAEDNKENENETWEQWSLAALKQPLHPALAAGVQSPSRSAHALPRLVNTTPKKRKRFQKPSMRRPVTSKQELLLEKKLELVSLQIELLKKEHEAQESRRQEKHRVEMRLLEKQCICLNKE